MFKFIKPINNSPAKILGLTIQSEEKSVARLGFEYKNYDYRSIEQFRKDNPKTIVVRFGNSYLPANKAFKQEEYDYVLNTSKAIILNCSKHLALKALSKVVNTPKLYEGAVKGRALVVIRPHAHSAGAGFRVARGPLKLNSYEYAINYIKSKTELRVWFVNGKTMTAKRVSTKHAKDKFPCRSGWGYEFRKTPKTLHKQVLAAAKAIGLCFGAADVIYYKGKYYFLELNSCPSYDNSKIIKMFQSEIPKLAQRKYPELFKNKRNKLNFITNIVPKGFIKFQW